MNMYSFRFIPLFITGCFAAVSILSGAAVAAEECPPNIVSYWKLDEGMGTVATDSVDANHGMLINGPIWTIGQVNSALSFGGMDDYILLPDSTNLSPTFAITLEAWIKPSTLVPDQHIFSTAGPGPSPFGHDYYIRLADGGNLDFRINDVSFYIVGAITISDQWYHVVGTYDQSEGLRKVYVNGNMIATDAYNSPINTGHNAVTIGINARNISFGSNFTSFHGPIDEAAIYDRALTLEEVQQHYQNGLNGKGYCPTTQVNIDIKPGSDPNCFNINGHGVIPVAILGSDTVDVANIDQGSLLFGGLEVRVRGNRGPLCGLEYSNGDAYLDLVCHFEDDAESWNPGDGEATLTGSQFDQTEFEGTDSICVVP